MSKKVFLASSKHLAKASKLSAPKNREAGIRWIAVNTFPLIENQEVQMVCFNLKAFNLGERNHIWNTVYSL